MIGKIIGNYQITSELAQGGMGAIYRGRHLHLPREVAVKSILLGSYSPSSKVQLKARLRREAYVQSQLDHPNIVRVYEFFAVRDNYYLVMEYVPGMSLRDLLARDGTPAPAQAIYLFKQALVALDYAHNFNYLDESERHNTGVIHRDIKPANMLLDTRGRLKITNFGIVKAMGEQRGMRMTQSGFHPGSVNYISPEQLLGREIDVRADLYSLGVSFYEIITGRLPFQRSAPSSDREIRKSQIEHDPIPIQDLRPDVHPQLAEIIMRSLRKKLEERFQSAATFMEALLDYEQNYAEKAQALRSPSVKPAQQWQEDADLQEMNPTSPMAPDESAPLEYPALDEIAPAPKLARSWRKWLLAACGIGLLLAGTAAGAIYFSQGKTPERPLQSNTPKGETPSPSPTLEPTPAPAASSGDRNASKSKPAAANLNMKKSGRGSSDDQLIPPRIRRKNGR